MYKSFQIISDSVGDLWKCDFLRRPLDSNIRKIPELKRAHATMLRILDERRKPSTKELTEDISPLLELECT